MRSQKKGWNNATTNPMKKKGRGKKKKKEFGSTPIKGKKEKKKRRLSSRELISEMAEIQEQERDDVNDVQHMKNVNYVISKKRPTHQKHISHDGKSYFQEIGTDKTVWTLPSDGVLLEEEQEKTRKKSFLEL